MIQSGTVAQTAPWGACKPLYHTGRSAELVKEFGSRTPSNEGRKGGTGQPIGVGIMDGFNRHAPWPMAMGPEKMGVN